MPFGRMRKYVRAWDVRPRATACKVPMMCMNMIVVRTMIRILTMIMMMIMAMIIVTAITVTITTTVFLLEWL